MNLSQLVTRIKVTCGIYMIALPFEHADEAIVDTIRDITRPTFSRLCPSKEDLRFNLDDLERLERHGNYEVYLLPDIFQERKLLELTDVRYDESDISGIGYWGGGIPLLQGNMLRQGMISNASLGLTNKLVPRISFKYFHPRKVKLWNVLSSAQLVFECSLEHDRNLTSITSTSEESFYKLALLDVQIVLYNTLKHYENLQTAYGNLALKMEEWQNAQSARDQLVEQWENTYHMDVLPFTYG